MKVAELIEMLQAFPQDAEVAPIHGNVNDAYSAEINRVFAFQGRVLLSITMTPMKEWTAEWERRNPVDYIRTLYGVLTVFDAGVPMEYRVRGGGDWQAVPRLWTREQILSAYDIGTNFRVEPSQHRDVI